MTVAKDVVCVLIAYWPERIANIAEICEDVFEGEVTPRKMIVFNNNPTWKLRDQDDEIFRHERICLIDSDSNFTSRSKYLLALMEPSPFYLLLDDDISVHPGMLRRFMRYAKPGCCFSNWGVNFVDNYASAGIQVKGINIPYSAGPVPVDIFIGIIQFVSFESIVKMLEVEVDLRLQDLPEYRSVGEDMLIAQAQGPGGAHVIGLKEYDAPKFMHLGSESMQGDWGYYLFRDKFSFDARRFTGHRIYVEDPIPGEQDYEQKAFDEYLETVRAREEVYKR
jgi:hypothetical protein